MIKQYLNQKVFDDKESTNVGTERGRNGPMEQMCATRNPEVNQTSMPPVQDGVFYHIGAAIVEEYSKSSVWNARSDKQKLSEFQKPDLELELQNVEQNELAKDMVLGANLSVNEKLTLRQLLDRYPNILTDVPGKTHLAEHEIRTTTKGPIRS